MQKSKLFQESEPTELKTYNIDYDTVEYTRAIVYTIERGESVTEPHEILFEGYLSIVGQYLVLKDNMCERGGLRLQWLNINLWFSRFSNTSSHSPYFCQNHITVQKGDQSEHLLIKIINEEDIQKIQTLIKQVCIITQTSLGEEFKFVKQLGQGMQALVRLYSRQEGENIVQYAIKSYYLGNNSRTLKIPKPIENEILFLRELCICENITHLDSVYYTKKEIHLVMTFAKDGSLLKYLSEQSDKFSEQQIRIIMEQLILALDLMHKKNIYHRDIKPDNILVKDKEELQLCIADLGLACRSTDTHMLKMKVGTPTYVAPEVLKGESFTSKSDIFSLGSFLFNLLTGKTLFKGDDMAMILHNNKHYNPLKSIEQADLKVSNQLKDLLQQMLHPDPHIRLSTEECLQHSWFLQDRNALQDSLLINTNAQYLINFMLQNRMNPAFGNLSSFSVAPNYFLGLSDSKDKTPPQKAHSLNPFGYNSIVKLESPQLKICYHQFITESRSRGVSPAVIKNKQLIFNFKLDEEQRLRNDKSKSTQEERKCEVTINMQEVNDTQDSMNENDFQEYSPFYIIPNDINYKYQHRFQLNDVQQMQERSLALKNKRKSNLNESMTFSNQIE